VHAVHAVRACGDPLLFDEVMTGTQPVLASAKMVENVAIANEAYAKFSRYERYLFRPRPAPSRTWPSISPTATRSRRRPR
jgi:hypothetical protein